MGNDNPTPMTGWGKRDAVEETLKTGDASKAQSVLSTVQDHKLFMDLLASKAKDDSSLTHLQITDGKDGSPQTIQSDKLVVSREQGPDGEKLTAHGVGMMAKAGEKLTAAGDSVKQAFKPLSDFAADFGEAWHNKGTSESITNRRIDKQIRQAEGDTPPAPPAGSDKK